MQQTHKGCCQPEGRVSAGAGRITRMGLRGAREGNWVNSWSKAKSQCWGAAEPLLSGAGYDLAVAMGTPTLVVFWHLFDLASWKLRTSWRLVLSLSSQQNLWHQTGSSLRCRRRQGTAGLDMGTSCHFYTPVIFILSKINYVPVWCCWICCPCTPGIWVLCPRRGHTWRINKRIFYWGRYGRGGHWVGGCELEHSADEALHHLTGIHTFIKVRLKKSSLFEKKPLPKSSPPPKVSSPLLSSQPSSHMSNAWFLLAIPSWQDLLLPQVWSVGTNYLSGWQILG